jgi:hypothetical protein
LQRKSARVLGVPAVFYATFKGSLALVVTQ